METIPIQQPIHILKLPMACNATSSNFYLPPAYETPILDVNISLNLVEAWYSLEQYIGLKEDFKPMYCSREYQASTRLSQQYEKSTSNIPQYGKSSHDKYFCP